MTPEEGRSLRIVAEVMDEVELCEVCGVDTGGHEKAVRTTEGGSLVRVLCQLCAVKESLARIVSHDRAADLITVDSVSHGGGERGRGVSPGPAVLWRADGSPARWAPPRKNARWRRKKK